MEHARVADSTSLWGRWQGCRAAAERTDRSFRFDRDEDAVAGNSYPIFDDVALDVVVAPEVGHFVTARSTVWHIDLSANVVTAFGLD